MFRIKYIVLALSLLMSSSIFADEEKKANSEDSNAQPTSTEKFLDKFSASTKITNNHVWRAISSGSAPCIEPYVSYRLNGLSVSAWSSYAIDYSYKEFDIFVKYDWEFLQVGLFDYYCPNPQVLTNDFTDFSSLNTRHLYEVQLNYTGHENFPLNIITGCFIGGFDKDENGSQLYSTYFEMNYTMKAKKNQLKAEVGMTPFKGMYADHFSVFNYGLTLMREIQITEKWSILSSYKLIYNKEINDLYFSVGFVLS